MSARIRQQAQNAATAAIRHQISRIENTLKRPGDLDEREAQAWDQAVAHVIQRATQPRWLTRDQKSKAAEILGERRSQEYEAMTQDYDLDDLADMLDSQTTDQDVLDMLVQDLEDAKADDAGDAIDIVKMERDIETVLDAFGEEAGE